MQDPTGFSPEEHAQQDALDRLQEEQDAEFDALATAGVDAALAQLDAAEAAFLGHRTARDLVAQLPTALADQHPALATLQRSARGSGIPAEYRWGAVAVNATDDGDAFPTFVGRYPDHLLRIAADASRVPDGEVFRLLSVADLLELRRLARDILAYDPADGLPEILTRADALATAVALLVHELPSTIR